jgi:very-short-patch-repair endonuclease
MRTEKKTPSAEDALAEALAADPIPGWDLTREYRFHPDRRWRFDFAFPSVRVAVEVDGKRHRTYSGIRSDCEKLNEAARLGWRVLRFPSDQRRRASEWADLIREDLCLPPSHQSG